MSKIKSTPSTAQERRAAILALKTTIGTKHSQVAKSLGRNEYMIKTYISLFHSIWEYKKSNDRKGVIHTFKMKDRNKIIIW